MKKIILLFTISLFALSSCNRGHKFTLNGEFDNLAVDTILVYYQSPFNKLDTIIAQKGKFEYSIPVDTLTLFSLYINHNQEIPIFAYKDGEATISGKVLNFKIDGEDDNLKMNEILAMERKLKKDTASIQEWIESYAKKNASSFTNIYLINKYFIQKSAPDYKRINDIFQSLHGNVMDVPFMVMAQEEVAKHLTGGSTSVSSISVPDKNGKFPAWDALRDKVSLISFWASWDKGSKEMQDSLSSIKKLYANKNFQIISISLDVDKNAWESNMPQDTIKWQQLCDFKGWDGNFVKQMKISKLPYTILLDKNMRIIATDVYGDALKKRIEQALNSKKK